MPLKLFLMISVTFLNDDKDHNLYFHLHFDHSVYFNNLIIITNRKQI